MYAKIYTCDVCIHCSVGTSSTANCRDHVLNGRTLGTGCFVPGKHNPVAFDGFNMNITWRWIRHCFVQFNMKVILLVNFLTLGEIKCSLTNRGGDILCVSMNTFNSLIDSFFSNADIQLRCKAVF